MIRFAENSDTDQVIELWNTCFYDESGFNEWFFSNIYEASQTLLYIKYDKICAMLQMIPLKLKINNDTLNVTYIYGACTSPNFRKQGLMAELLNYSFELDKKAGNYASILIPQEEWLFDFYKKFGYETTFYLQNRLIFSDSKLYNNNTLFECTTEDIDSLNMLYNQENQFSILRNREDWKQQINLFSEIGDGAYCLKTNGKVTSYAFLWKIGDNLWAQEALACDDSQLFSLAQQIMRAKNADKIKLTGNNGTEPFGCAKFYYNKGLPTNGKDYINLLFN